MEKALVLDFLCEIKLSDWISIASIIVNGVLGLFIVITFQKNVTNKRVLKDHFISEIKELQKDYTDYIELLFSDKINARSFQQDLNFKMITTNDLISLIRDEFKIDNTEILTFHLSFQKIVDEKPEYTSVYRNNSNIKLNPSSKVEIKEFYFKSKAIFNKIIIEINKS